MIDSVCQAVKSGAQSSHLHSHVTTTMVNHLVRDSFAGRVLYHLSGHKLFSYPEEQPGYVVPDRYRIASTNASSLDIRSPSVASSEQGSNAKLADDLEKTVGTALADTHFTTKECKNADGLIFVDWDGDDDPENPYNWPVWQKAVFVSMMSFLTLSVYMGSAIYTPCFESIREEFNATQAGAVAGLSTFVFGYALGPMIFSPLSEHPSIGRTYIYIATLTVFVILQIPTALATNLPGFLILRFISGFFASPTISTGGASLADVVCKADMPLGLGLWSLAAVCGPFLGPLVGAGIVSAGGWRWVFWFLLILGASALLVLTFFLPETLQATLLHRKAARLRALTGNPNIVAKDAYEAAQKPFRQVALETLWRPIEVSFLEPMVLSVNCHLALVYSLTYLWFESFPIVFGEIYGFSAVLQGTAFVGMMIGTWVGLGIYLWYMRSRFTLPVRNGDDIAPEIFLPPNLGAAITLPIGLFIFAWSSTASVHWIVPIIATAIFGPGFFLLFQTHLNYLGYVFPKYMASVFAGSALFRSCAGAAFPLFANALYHNTGSDEFPVGWGVSIMAFISLGMVGIPIVFLWKGKQLREWSKRGE